MPVARTLIPPTSEIGRWELGEVAERLMAPVLKTGLGE